MYHLIVVRCIIFQRYQAYGNEETPNRIAYLVGNNSLHYGSDAGAEMAATYHSVIGKVKLHGSSARDFIGLRMCQN